MTAEVLDRDSSVPLYVQLSNLLRAKIERGEWKPDDRIPSENDFNALYGISRMTARQVLARLVEEGLLFRVQGKGTFVAHRKISTRSPSYMGIREQLERQGYATRTEILSQEAVGADAKIASALGLEPGEHVYLIRRLRFVEDLPISIHESYVPEAMAPNMVEHDLVNQQLCTVLEENYGLGMAHVSESLESEAAGKPQAKLLGVRAGSPLIVLEQRVSSESGIPFEYSRIHFRGDKIRLEFEYNQTSRG